MTKKYYNYNDKILRDIRTLYESKKDYYKPIKTNSAFNNDYIEYESNGDKNKILSGKEYLETQNEWEIQLSLAVYFVSLKNFKVTFTMCTNSDNIDIIIGYEIDQITEELFNSLLQRYQKGYEGKMRGSEFVYGIDLFYYKLHKISLNRGQSYIDSPKWLKNKKSTINPKNNDNNCFQYAITIALNYQNIKHNPERISNIKPFL